MTNFVTLQISCFKSDAKFALERAIPSMEKGFRISTNWGDMLLSGDDAKAVMVLVEEQAKRKAKS